MNPITHTSTHPTGLQSSMSRPPTLNGTESLRQLLGEKEKDLELAARIGQSLLSKNRILQANHDELAQLFTVAQDELTQLRHELSMNKDLLKIYAHDTPDSENFDFNSEVLSPSLRHIRLLQERLQELEDENFRLRQDAKELSAEAADFETKETEIMHGCVKELTEQSENIKALSAQLTKKSEENAVLHDDISALLSEIVELQTQVKKAAVESTELRESIDIHKENQNHLAYELIQLQDKYDALSGHAHSLEDELKDLRKTDGYIQSWADMSSTISHFSKVDSLATELNNSLQYVYNSVGFSDDEQEDQYKKVMDIVRLVNVHPSQAQTTSTSVNSSSASIMSTTSSAEPSPRKLDSSRTTNSDTLSVPLGSYFGGKGPRNNSESRPSSSSTDDGICDKTFVSSVVSFDNRCCATPDSALSSGSACDLSFTSRSSGYSDMSTKLQLIKPMEGSQTLLRWQQLATPHLGGFLESRPGIVTKGQSVIADEIVAEARRSSGTDISSERLPCVQREVQTKPNYTFTTSNGGHAAKSPSSIFSVDVLKSSKLKPKQPPVFPSVEPSSSPGPSLTDVLLVDKKPSLLPSCDSPSAQGPFLMLEERNERCRSRHTSGSLSSASRSPSPVLFDLPSDRHAFQTLYPRSPFQKSTKTWQIIARQKSHLVPRSSTAQTKIFIGQKSPATS